MQELSTDSGVARNTIKRYIEYLEAAFLKKKSTRPGELKALTEFCRRNNIHTGWATTRTISKTVELDDLTIRFIPTSELCYTVGYNIIHGRHSLTSDSP